MARSKIPRTEHLGLALVVLRLRRSLSQADLAERSHVDVSTLSRLENGHQHPRLSTLLHLLGAMQHDLASLLQVQRTLARLARTDCPPTMAQIAAAVTALRKRKGWSCEELAQRSGVGAEVVWHLEHGFRSPMLPCLLEILAALSLRPGEFEALARQVAAGPREKKPAG